MPAGSCRICRVLFDVGEREVGGVDGRGVGAGVQRDLDPDLPPGQVDQPPGLARRPAPAHRDAIDRDVELVGLERRRGGAKLVNDILLQPRNERLLTRWMRRQRRRRGRTPKAA